MYGNMSLWELSVLFTQFGFEPKTSLTIKVY